MLHAGGVNGWVEGGDLVFTSKTNSTDYQDKMNFEMYLHTFAHFASIQVLHVATVGIHAIYYVLHLWLYLGML